MTLEITLRRPLTLPRFLQMGGGEPPRAHWINKPVTPNQEQGASNNNNAPKKKSSRGYRDLSTIRLGEVNDAFQFFANQLAPSPYPSWIAPNYFCMIHLVEKHDHPPVVFGRVKTCYPSDGQIQNIREMELLFPRKDGEPDTILLHASDIRYVESYLVRVKCFATDEEAAEFAGSEGMFAQYGFLPEFERGYLELLEIEDHAPIIYPWIHLIGSRWFASIPDSVRDEIVRKLRPLVDENPLAFNYHPEYLDGTARTLNRALGYKAKVTDHFIVEPETPQQSASLIAEAFNRIFNQGMR